MHMFDPVIVLNRVELALNRQYLLTQSVLLPKMSIVIRQPGARLLVPKDNPSDWLRGHANLCRGGQNWSEMGRSILSVGASPLSRHWQGLGKCHEGPKDSPRPSLRCWSFHQISELLLTHDIMKDLRAGIVPCGYEAQS